MEKANLFLAYSLNTLQLPQEDSSTLNIGKDAVFTLMERNWGKINMRKICSSPINDGTETGAGYSYVVSELLMYDVDC